MEDVLAIIFIFGGGTLFALSVSPIGRAIAARIRKEGSGEAVEQLRETQLAVLDDLDALRQELTDVQERIDFTERLLAQQRDAGQLPGLAEPGEEGTGR
jgi:hypothetical protein